MYLLLAIVQAEDADLLCERLAQAGHRATRINTVGGFLARGNVSVLMGVEEDKLETIFSIIRATCRTRKAYTSTALWASEPGHITLAMPAMPLEIEVGGATIFGLPVKRHVRIQGGAQQFATDILYSVTAPREGETPMNLVLAIVHREDVDAVTDNLLHAGYRVTQISTAGAFLRRGNTTLLIGVEPDKVNDVLRLIQASCKARPEANPVDKGMPMYSATIFVLESQLFERI